MDEKIFECEFCNHQFKTRGNLKSHQQTTKYCLELQGKSVKNHHCHHCFKNLASEKILREHLVICKEKDKERIIQLETTLKQQTKLIQQDKNDKIKKIEKVKQECEDKYEKKMEKQKEEYEKKLEKQREEYERKIEKQRQEYEEKLERQQDFIKTMAMKPTSSTKTMNVIHNHNTLNFNDKEKLNNVIRNNIDQEVVKRGQIGVAGVLYQNYLKNVEGKLLYHVSDTSRQNFEYIDENGEKKTDIGAQTLTEAVVKSDLSKHVSNIAKDMPNLYEEDGNLDSVLQLTEFDKDNSKFRKEIVRLTNSKK